MNGMCRTLLARHSQLRSKFGSGGDISAGFLEQMTRALARRALIATNQLHSFRKLMAWELY